MKKETGKGNKRQYGIKSGGNGFENEREWQSDPDKYLINSSVNMWNHSWEIEWHEQIKEDKKQALYITDPNRMKPFISPWHCHSLCRFQPRTQFDLFLLYSFRDSVTLVAEIVINIITWRERERKREWKGSLFKISFRVHRVNYRLTKSIKFVLWPSSPVINKKK